MWIPKSSGTAAHQRLINLHVEFINLTSEIFCANARTVQETSGKKRSLGKRETDIMFTKRSSPNNSELNSSSSNNSSEHHAHRTAVNPAYAVGEITSCNYHNDIFSKWRDYFNVGIQLYFIFHLHEKRSTKRCFITVGSLNKKPGFRKSENGNFQDMPSSSTRSAAHRTKYFYKKVFSGNQVRNRSLRRVRPNS